MMRGGRHNWYGMVVPYRTIPYHTYGGTIEYQFKYALNPEVILFRNHKDKGEYSCSNIFGRCFHNNQLHGYGMVWYHHSI